MTVEIKVNGTLQRLKLAPRTTLLEVLREQLGLKGTKEGCGIGQCGACTVLLDGNPVNACLLLAVQADGHRIETIENLATQDQLHPLQSAFVEEHAVQCGFCTPGMLIASKALLEQKPKPEFDEIRQAISGNVCRCSGYSKIIKAVNRAAGDSDTDIKIKCKQEVCFD